jgi:hypothetical protein
MTIAMIALSIGALLGLRLKVFILVPAIVMGSATILCVGIARSDSIWPTLLAAVLATTALQVGYLVGVVVHFSIAKARGRDDSARTIAAAQRTTF